MSGRFLLLRMANGTGSRTRRPARLPAFAVGFPSLCRPRPRGPQPALVSRHGRHRALARHSRATPHPGDPRARSPHRHRLHSELRLPPRARSGAWRGVGSTRVGVVAARGRMEHVPRRARVVCPCPCALAFGSVHRAVCPGLVQAVKSEAVASLGCMVLGRLSSGDAYLICSSLHRPRLRAGSTRLVTRLCLRL